MKKNITHPTHGECDFFARSQKRVYYVRKADRVKVSFPAAATLEGEGANPGTVEDEGQPVPNNWRDDVG